MRVYDIVITGGGPAGITAAIYGARQKAGVLLVTKDIGGQTLWSGSIENYTGFNLVSGTGLIKRFEEHLKGFDIEIIESEQVTGVRKEEALTVTSTSRKEYAGKTAIIASGKKPRELNVPGEKEFRAKGVQYCATCDGPIFSGMDVAVIGGGNSALDAALQLVNNAQKVYMINNSPALTGERIMAEKLAAKNNIEIINDAGVARIKGGKFVESLVYTKNGREKEISVRGVFVEIGLIPNSGFAGGLAKNRKGEIKVNCLNETSVPGIFAAGDVTNVPEKQIIISAGEGAKAALSAAKYINTHNFSNGKRAV